MADNSVPFLHPFDPTTSNPLTEPGSYSQAPIITTIVCSAAASDSIYAAASIEPRASPTAPHQRSATEPSYPRSPGTPHQRTGRLRSKTSVVALEDSPDATFLPSDDEEQLKQSRNSSTSSKKMFNCVGYGECTMSFSRAEHLARHVRKHTGERPFTCHCGRGFSRLDNLRQHAHTVHADQAELNAGMMARLAEIHNSLAVASGGGRKPKPKPKATTPKRKKEDVQNDRDRTPAPHPLDPSTSSYFQSMEPFPPMPSSAPANVPFFPPTVYNQQPPRSAGPYPDVTSIYEDHVVQGGGEIHPDDYASYALYSKPALLKTLPSISALIPRMGGQVSQQEMSQLGLLPSPLQESTQAYGGHTTSGSAPAYLYMEQPSNVSPKSASPAQIAHQHQQQQQQQMHHYMAMHGGQTYPYQSHLPPQQQQQNEFDPQYQFFPRSFSASSASSANSYGSEPSLMSAQSSTFSRASYPSTPSPTSKQHLRMPAGAGTNFNMAYAGSPLLPSVLDYSGDQQVNQPCYLPTPMFGPLPTNSHELIPTDLGAATACLSSNSPLLPTFSAGPPPFARRPSLNDLVSAATAHASPSVGYASPAMGAGSPAINRREEGEALYQRQGLMI